MLANQKIMVYTISEKERQEFDMLQNLHTHTTFCDGKNTAREMIESAIAMGFDSLGFSGHAPTVQKTDWEMKDLGGYKSEILKLAEEYADRIKIFLGIELDRYSKGAFDERGFDYKIGSVHMTFKNGVQVDYDHNYEKSKAYIDELFDGDSLEYARLYFSTLAELPSVFDFDFVGHFDVLTKFSEKHPELIPTESKKYKDMALEALHALREKKEFFEVNTGAISRGHRTTSYPAPFILDEMKTLNCKLILTSDCHTSTSIDCNFKEAKEYIKSHGFDSLYYLTENGFVGEKF